VQNQYKTPEKTMKKASNLHKTFEFKDKTREKAKIGKNLSAISYEKQ